MNKITVLDSTGDRTVEVGFDDAIKICKEEMAKLKWLYVENKKGEAYMVTSVEEVQKNLNRLKDDFEDAKTLIISGQQQGGACGVVYQLSANAATARRSCHCLERGARLCPGGHGP